MIFIVQWVDVFLNRLVRNMLRLVSFSIRLLDLKRVDKENSEKEATYLYTQRRSMSGNR